MTGEWRCRTCKHWRPSGRRRDKADRGDCAAIYGDDCDLPASTGDSFGYDSYLQTKPDFGCTLWIGVKRKVGHALPPTPAAGITPSTPSSSGSGTASVPTMTIDGVTWHARHWGDFPGPMEQPPEAIPARPA